MFASYDAVLYALHRGGNLAWRGSLPSRPLSPPLVVSGYLLVACLENELVIFAPETGRSASASMRTTSLIHAPPIVAGPVVALGLSDRSVVGYAIGAAAPPAAQPPPPAEPAKLAAPAPGRLD